MANISIFPYSMSAKTTIDLEKADQLKMFCEELKELYLQSDLIVSYWDLKTERVKEVALSSMSWDGLLSETRDENDDGYYGSIALSDLNKKIFSASYEWRKYYRDKWEEILKAKTMTQNSLSMSFQDETFIQSSQRKRFVEFCEVIAKKIRVNYLLVYQPKNDNRLRKGNADCLAGLNDIYWLNIFGRPFIEIIGEDLLMSAPAWRVEGLNSTTISLQASEEFCDRENLDCALVLKNIRDHIGGEYFYKFNQKTKEESGVVSIYQFVRSLYRDYKIRNDTKRHAEVIPVIDWSQMIIDRKGNQGDGNQGDVAGTKGTL